MQKKIKFIFVLLAITLCSCLKGNESLELQSITGLSESETMRFLVDWNEAFPNSKAYKIEKVFQIPKGPYYISVYYDCIWDGSKGYYSGQHLTVSIEDGKHYRDNTFPKKSEAVKNHKPRGDVGKIYFTRDFGGFVSLSGDINRKDFMWLKELFTSDYPIKIEDKEVPVSMMKGRLKEIQKVEENMYMINLHDPHKYIVLKKKGDTFELIYRIRNIVI